MTDGSGADHRAEPTQANNPSVAAASICIFCGSRSGSASIFSDAAQDLGRQCAEDGWTVVYGGGNIGLMQAVADAALGVDGKVIGVIPKELLAREAGKREVTELIVTETMFERKSRMIAMSDAFVVLPGGYGTLDELLEVITLKQLGYHAKPIIIINLDGFWSPCIELFSMMFDTGFARPSFDQLLIVVDTVESAMSELRLGLVEAEG